MCRKKSQKYKNNENNENNCFNDKNSYLINLDSFKIHLSRKNQEK